MSNEMRFLYQISQFLGVKLSTRSHVLRITVYQNINRNRLTPENENFGTFIILAFILLSIYSSQ